MLLWREKCDNMGINYRKFRLEVMARCYISLHPAEWEAVQLGRKTHHQCCILCLTSALLYKNQPRGMVRGLGILERPSA